MPSVSPTQNQIKNAETSQGTTIETGAEADTMSVQHMHKGPTITMYNFVHGVYFIVVNRVYFVRVQICGSPSGTKLRPLVSPDT